MEMLNRLTYSLTAAAQAVASRSSEKPPETNRDKLNVVMGYARARRKRNLHKMTELSKAFPDLCKFNQDFSRAADQLLIEIASYYHDEARKEDIRKAEEKLNTFDDNYHSSQNKRQLLQRLKSYIPGAKPCLRAVWDECKQAVVTSEEEVAKAANRHWQQVFDEKEIENKVVV